MKFCTDIYFYGSLCLKISCNLDKHGVKSFRIRRFYGPCFPAFGLCGELLGISPYSVQMRETADQKNYEYGNFLRRENSFTVLFTCIYDNVTHFIKPSSFIWTPLRKKGF